MTRDELVKLARKMGISAEPDALFLFAAQIAAAERRECMDACDMLALHMYSGEEHAQQREVIRLCSFAIRMWGGK